ncbi:hypothetical protein PMI42_01709 [Bradyrhizobium sp. YR681]|uniref:hypothetical protein n=1 Tax=Bradyrhizobium sp. YR681 TaxID=1144344 RepID=UPI0002712A4F|nr:hypothetical protein [Bradyrhizobium sp. YR681]EJN14735.1 hypothetical protein PMI42_01709 [Bradyrhizobium sp. YR681]
MDDQQQAQGDQVAPAAAPTLEEIEAKRNAENLERAKAGGYVEPVEPSISERVAALVAGVQHAIEHNSPISREHFEEMKALLGHREGSAPQGEQSQS